jgi:ubiquinone/menaquinone biosynthesis C-methylase UbiE
MSGEMFREWRTQTLTGAKGEVLEIGFGSGLNLPHYPPEVTRITTADPNPGMGKLAQKRIKASPIPVEHHVISGEKLPFEDNSFDTVVSTWTLCSIPQVEQALAELRRVLKPGGQFLFIEHGLSPNLKVQRWQNRLNPLQKTVADGCNLNRNMRVLIEKYFKLEKLKEFNLTENAPAMFQVANYMYQGVGVKG